MHPRTTATLAQLQSADWFANVGLHTSSAVVALADWPSAIASCASLDWENVCLEAANQYRDRLRERSAEAMGSWNDVVDQVRPFAEALVDAKTRQVIHAHDLPKVFADTVKWDILHLCMESEFADVYPPGFYASQAYWYRKGHFPCGWRGAFPSGLLVIL
jgi:hypothetical protein